MTKKSEKVDEKMDTSDANQDKKEEGTVEVEKKDPNVLTVEDIREHCRLIERSVVSKENRFIVRVLRSLNSTRKRLNPIVLRRVINGFYTHSAQEKELLLAYLPEEEVMDVDGGNESSKAMGTGRLRGAKSASTPLLPEVDCYLHLLVLVYLLDQDGKDKKTNIKCSEDLMTKLLAQNRRSLDHIAAKCYYYHSMSYEKGNDLSKIRGFLHSRLRTATLRNDFEGQAVLINCLLRNYLDYNIYDQADKLVQKTTFPENASNNEWARYLYYLGRIKAIQLEYTEAHKFLVQSLRKAPQYAALGFRNTVQKLTVTVKLLLGEIPERQIFLTQSYKKALHPYFQLTQAIRLGDVDRFGKVLDTYGSLFKQDRTYTLILRLHHNVIKTAIRTISLAYTRISLADVAEKLRLDSPEEAEYIIAKAIRDGVIEAVLDHENGWMQSKENIDIYCTREPQLAFHKRIEFCLELHNQSVKAMRFPPKSYNQDLESAEDRREREAQDLELAKEMAEEDDDLI